MWVLLMDPSSATGSANGPTEQAGPFFSAAFYGERKR
jgi:hypothetical protein